ASLSIKATTCCQLPGSNVESGEIDLKRTLVLVFFMALISLAAMSEVAKAESGTWFAKIEGPGRLQMTMIDNRESIFGESYNLNQFQGLSLPMKGRVDFQRRTDPGTFFFTGSFSGNEGKGDYRFEFDPRFVTD